jgi:hypothetical protein
MVSVGMALSSKIQETVPSTTVNGMGKGRPQTQYLRDRNLTLMIKSILDRQVMN